MEFLKWHTETRRVGDLIPLDCNPRIRNGSKQKKLQDSISRFNLVDIPVINLDGSIIAGQRRWEVYMDTGRANEDIEVRVPNRLLTEDEVKEYNLIANTHAGEWDLPKLEASFASLYRDIIPDLPQVAAPVLPSAASIVSKNGEISEDGFEELPRREVITRPGDLYELNSHRLLCADSTDINSLTKLMSGKLADMVFTDPPYNVRTNDIGNKGKVKHDDFAMAAGEMTRSRFTRFLEDIFVNLIKSSRDGSIHYICMDWKHVGEITAAAGVYSKYMNMIVWKKSNAGMGSFYRSQHELIFVYRNGKKKHINNFGLGETGRYRTNIWEYAGMNSAGNREREILKDHPTPKPVKLVADAILDCSNPFGTVLDVFLGSGTTLIAAEQTNRICHAIEMEPAYMDLSIIRYIRFMQSHKQTVAIRRNGVKLTQNEISEYVRL
ncbi:MAG: DNA modification methylase [Prevotellaceae bacterium]|nr:DNA modification methylase [Prevotellaceae bacterium]